MSDPAKSPAEIEDVLSSIRRLVSEHHPAPKPEAVSPSPVAEPQPDPKETESRLVLTPALRVTDPDDPWAPVPRTPDADTEVHEEARAFFQRSRAAVAAEPVADDPADDDAAPALDAVDPDAPFPAEPAEPDPEEAHVAPEPEIAPAVEDVPAEVTSEAEELAAIDAAEDAERAELALLDGEIPDRLTSGFEPEVGDDDWPDSGAGRAARNLAAMRGAHEAASAEARKTDESDAADIDIDLSAAFAAPQAEPEVDMSDPEHRSDAPEPDTPEATDEAKSAEAMVYEIVDDAAEIDVADVIEPQTHDDAGADASADETPDAALDDEVEDLGEEPSPFTFPDSDEDSFLDEETLREMIVDIVREELQGALGQRITRNVRKMVRREIRIALAAEDLE